MGFFEGLNKLANSSDILINKIEEAIGKGVEECEKQIKEAKEKRQLNTTVRQENVSSVQEKRDEILAEIRKVEQEIDNYKATVMPDGGNYCDKGFPDFWSVARPILHLDTCFNCKNLVNCKKENYLAHERDFRCKNNREIEEEYIPTEEECNHYCATCKYNTQSCRDGDLRPQYRFFNKKITCEMKKD